MRRMNRFALAVAVACIAVASGCEPDDKKLAEKDQQIAELRGQKESLSRQLADANSAQQLAQAQLADERRRAGELETAKNATAKADATPEKPTGTSTKPAKDAPADNAKPTVEQATSVKDADVVTESRADGSTVFRLGGSASFASGSDKLTPRGKEALDKIAAEINKTKGPIEIEGHTDSSPLGRTKQRYGDNLGLSLARAVAVKDYLVEHGKIEKSRLSVSGKGDTKPISAGNSKEGQAQNRRVEIILRNE